MRFHRAVSLLSLWILSAFVVVAVVLRLALPELPRYRPQLEAWVASTLGRPVTIGRLEATWRGWYPHLRLTDFRLLDEATYAELLRFDSADIDIDLLKTFATLHLSPTHLTLSGPDILIDRGPDGIVTVQGFDPRTVELGRWILEQPNIVLRFREAYWHDRYVQREKLTLTNAVFHAQRDGDHHAVSIVATPPAATAQQLRFNLRYDGDLWSGQWRGETFVEGKSIAPDFLINYAQRSAVHAASGSLDLSLWADWSDGSLRKVTGELGANDLLAKVKEHALPLTNGRGHFVLSHIGPDEWRLDVDRLKLSTPGGAWPAVRAAFHRQRVPDSEATAWDAYVSYVRLQDLAPLLLHVATLPDALRDWCRNARPQGELREVRIGHYPQRPEPERYFLRADFTDAGFGPVRHQPGIKGLHGLAEANAAGGRLTLSSTRARIENPLDFADAIPLDRLDAALVWQAGVDRTDIRIEQLAVQNADLTLTLDGRVSAEAQAGLDTDLNLTIDRMDLARVRAYVPLTTPPDTREWLTRAFIAGEARSGRASLKGKPSAFPFDRGGGAFKAEVPVTGGTLDYAPGWPRIEAIEGKILFANRDIGVQATSGTLYGAELRDVAVAIPAIGLGKEHVKVTGRADGTAAQGLRFLNQSPLQESVGSRLADVSLDGDIAVALELVIPLDERESTVAGTVQLNGNQLVEKTTDVRASAIKGALSFTEDSLTGRGIAAKMFGRPVSVDIVQAPDADTPTVTINGRADPKFIGERLAALGDSPHLRRFVTALSGETAFTVTLALSEPSAGNAANENFRIDSMLEGLAIDAPAPLGKQAHERRVFELRTTLARQSSGRIALDYGDHVRAVVQRPDNGKAASIAIALGGQPPSLPEGKDLWLGGRLDTLSLSAWSDFLDVTWPPTAPRADPAPYPRKVVALQIGALEALGYDFDNLKLDAHSDFRTWRLTLNSPDANGTLNVLPGEHVDARFKTLKLKRSATHAHPTLEQHPRHLPAVDLHCDDFSHEAVWFGAMDVITVREADGLRLEKLNFDSPHAKIQGKGNWKVTAERHESQFDLDVQSPALGTLLETFGYSGSDLDGGKTDMTIHAGWPGGPAAFDLAKLNGTLHLKLEDGRLLKVENRVGRIFGLLSINTIWRRLSLDFSDLFQEGFSFDVIEGEFHISRGNAYTDNLRVEGPSANVDVSGRTGLAKRDYDQTVVVTPALASSLPMASALFGPAGMGVGAAVLLAEKVFPQIPENIDKMLSSKYTVKGSWDSPLVESQGKF